MKQLTLVRFLQFARASSVPAGWKRRRIGKGVRGFKLVMVSAVKLRYHVPVNPSPTLLPRESFPLHPDKFSVSSRVHFASAFSLPVRPTFNETGA